MTGFGSSEQKVVPFGKIRIELRSTNHKFLETVVHLPERFLSLEDKIKKEIESQIKRGRITCVLNLSGSLLTGVFIDKALLRKYISLINGVKKQLKIKDDVSINTLINLPGVLSLREERVSRINAWPVMRTLLNKALEDLVKMRSKEGRALSIYLKNRSEVIKANVGIITKRFKKAVKNKISTINTDEERAAFLKDADISEEIERLSFHVRNFISRLSKRGSIGKELDFITQEMQREANTLAAKTFDVAISARAVQIKSQIEKLREQVQNIE
jgi:uncharacterized protein (TIGR00255 family)